MTFTKELNRKFKRAATSALVAWKGNFNRDELSDLINDLWQWYLERPSVRNKLDNADSSLFQALARKHAITLLSMEANKYDVFSGRVMYSSEAVKAALSGEPQHKYLLEILPVAMDRLVERHEQYADALKRRFIDGIIPKQGTEAQRVTNAVKALTEEVNVIALTTRAKQHEGPGSRKKIVFREDDDDFDGEGGEYVEVDETKEGGGGLDPASIRGKGTHGDPTGNLALALIEKPELREDAYYETPLREFLGGRGYEQPS